MSTSLSESILESLSASLSESTSISLSESIHESLSASLSESASIRASERASEAALRSETNNPGAVLTNGSVSASETAAVATDTTTSENDFREIPKDEVPEAIRIVSPIESIIDARTPLAVILDDEEERTDTTKEDTIDEDRIAKAQIGRSWWYWILVIISTLISYRASKKKKACFEMSEGEE